MKIKFTVSKGTLKASVIVFFLSFIIAYSYIFLATPTQDVQAEQPSQIYRILTSNSEETCSGNVCEQTIYMSPKYDTDIVGIWRNITEILVMENKSSEMLQINYKDGKQVNLTFIAENPAGNPVPPQSIVGWNQFYQDKLSRWKFGYELRLPNNKFLGKVQIDSNENLVIENNETGSIFIDPISINFADVLIGNYTINTILNSPKSATVEIHKDYSAYGVSVGDLILIDPETTIKANDTGNIARDFSSQTDFRNSNTFEITGLNAAEFSAAEYTAIGASDDSRVTTSVGQWYGGYTVYNYTLPTFTTLDWVFMSWEGNCQNTFSNDCYLYFWNASSETWIEGEENETCSGSDQTLTKNLTANPSIHVNTTTNTFHVFDACQIDGVGFGSDVRSDYAYITILYNLNTAPTVVSNTINDTTPVYGTDAVSHELTCQDADSGDTLTAYCSFYLNDVNQTADAVTQAVVNGTATQIINISYDRFSASDTAIFGCYCGDGTENTAETNTSTATYQTATPTLTLTLDGDATATQSRTYPNATDVQASESNSVDTDCEYTLVQNGSVISSGALTLAAESYNFTYNTSGCTNFTTASVTRELIVSKGDVSITAYINGSEANYSVEWGKPYLGGAASAVNFTADSNTTGSIASLHLNDTNFGDYFFNATRDAELNNLTSDFGSFTGAVNMSFNFTVSMGDENYTANSSTLFLWVYDSVPPQWANASVNVTNNTVLATYGTDTSVQVNTSWYDNYNGDAAFCWMEYNSTTGVANTTGTGVQTGADGCLQVFNLTDSSAGNIIVRVYANDTMGNENYTEFRWTVAKKAFTLGLSPTTGTITYETASAQYATSNDTQPNTLATLWRNDVNITDLNGTSETLGVGTWNFVVNTTRETANYSWTEQTATVTVIKKAFDIGLSPSTSTITYPTTVTQYATSNDTQPNSWITLWRNDTNITALNNTAESLNAGNPRVWYFVANTTHETANYSWTAQTATVTVNWGNTSVNLLLNGTDGDKYYRNNTAMNFTATINTTGQPISILTNITGWDNTTSSADRIENNTVWSSASNIVYEITANYTATENYTASSETHYVYQDVTLPTVISFGLNGTYAHFNQSIQLRVNVSDSFGISSIVALVQNATTSFNVTLTQDGTTNYTYNLSKTELGDAQTAVAVINITEIYTNDTSDNNVTNTTSLEFDYAKTNSITSAASPSSPASGETTSITVNYTTSKNISIGYNCTVSYYSTTYLMVWSAGYHTASFLNPAPAATTNPYTVTCTNSSYETQTTSGTIDTRGTGAQTGGNGRGTTTTLPLLAVVSEETICGDGVCDVGETWITCPTDCEAPEEPMITKVSLAIIGVGAIYIVNKQSEKKKAKKKREWFEV